MTTSSGGPAESSDSSDPSDPPASSRGEIDDNSMPLDMREKVEWPDDSDSTADVSPENGDGDSGIEPDDSDEHSGEAGASKP